MFKNKYLLIICFFYILSGCKKDTVITFSETNFTSSNNKIVEVNIPFAKENSEVAKSINSVINNHVIAALQFEESNNNAIYSIEKSIEKFNTEYTNFLNDFPESALKWEAQIDGEVIFKTQDIISISLTSYTNTGGAHGTINISFLNFDAVSGKLIENNKLFTDIEAFKIIAKKHFDTSIEDKESLFDSKTFKLPKNIGYSDEGIILLYNTYEIAPYATGIIEFTIPLEDAKAYLVFNSF